MAGVISSLASSSATESRRTAKREASSAMARLSRSISAGPNVLFDNTISFRSISNPCAMCTYPHHAENRRRDLVGPIQSRKNNTESQRWESNPQPPHYECGALPIEATLAPCLCGRARDGTTTLGQRCGRVKSRMTSPGDRTLPRSPTDPSRNDLRETQRRAADSFVPSHPLQLRPRRGPKRPKSKNSGISDGLTTRQRNRPARGKATDSVPMPPETPQAMRQWSVAGSPKRMARKRYAPRAVKRTECHTGQSVARDPGNWGEAEARKPLCIKHLHYSYRAVSAPGRSPPEGLDRYISLQRNHAGGRFGTSRAEPRCRNRSLPDTIGGLAVRFAFACGRRFARIALA